MKKLVCMFLLSSAAPALARSLKAETPWVQPSLTYVGSGNWRSDEAKVKGGKYTASMAITQISATENQVDQTYTDSSGMFTSWSYNAVQRPSKPSYYDLYVNGAVAGWGYCFAVQKGKKCHYNVSVDGIDHDLWFTVNGFNLLRYGSHTDSNGNHIIFRENLIVQNPPSPKE